MANKGTANKMNLFFKVKNAIRCRLTCSTCWSATQFTAWLSTATHLFGTGGVESLAGGVEESLAVDSCEKREVEQQSIASCNMSTVLNKLLDSLVRTLWMWFILSYNIDRDKIIINTTLHLEDS